MCHQKGYRLWLSPKYFDVHVNYQRCFYRFKHQYLKAAMRRYRRGPKYGINPLSLAYLEINVRFEGCTTMVAVEPRICENPTGEATFVLQVQGWVLFNYPDPHLRKRRLGIWDLDFVNVCADVSLSDIKMGPLLAEFLKEHDFTSKQKTVSRMFHCETCHLDFQIEVRNYARGPAVPVTRWIDLGQGLDATDPLWQACRAQACYGGTIRGAAYGGGHIRDMFLAAGGPDAEVIVRNYERYLFEGRFKEYMRQWNSHTWILKGEEVLWLWNES